MEKLGAVLAKATQLMLIAANRERIVKVRELFQISADATDEEVFIRAHHEYYQSRPEDDVRYGGNAYREYVDSGEETLVYYMRVVRGSSAAA